MKSEKIRFILAVLLMAPARFAAAETFEECLRAGEAEYKNQLQDPNSKAVSKIAEDLDAYNKCLIANPGRTPSRNCDAASIKYYNDKEALLLQVRRNYQVARKACYNCYYGLFTRSSASFKCVKECPPDVESF